MLIMFASLLTFYVQTWDEYHTKTLTLGIVSGPVEGIITLCIVYALTAVQGGGSFWHQSMLSTLHVSNPGFIPKAIYDLAWTDWYMVYGGLVLVFNTYSSAKNVVASRRSRKEDPNEALIGLAPFAVQWIAISAYLYLNPAIMSQHLVPFGLYVGLINAYSVGQMITAHLTKSPFPYWNVLILPLFFGISDALGPILQDHLGKGFGWPASLGDDGSIFRISFMFMSLGLAIGVYGSFVVDVIVNICDYLDIWCLTIKYPHDPSKEEAKKSK
ncbi:hypothetical protein ANO11243_073390 [Dothideomycetidae sp. 11243]|nr:hypothetical protein ANO11243_073390 [fungal sp. No.11243]